MFLFHYYERERQKTDGYNLITADMHRHRVDATSYCVGPCADPESFVIGGPTLTFFSVDEGR